MARIEGGTDKQEERLPAHIIASFGSVGLPLAAFLIVFGVYLPRYFVALGLPFATVGGAIAMVRLLDIGVDPIIGYFMDQTRTSMGRYRPWLLAATPVLMIGIFMLTMPQASISMSYLMLWLLVSYAGFSVLMLGSAAWGAVLALSYHERSRLYGLTQSMAVLGTVLLLLLPAFTHGVVVPGKVASMPVIGWIMIVSIPVVVALCLAVVPERIAPAKERPRFRLADYRAAVFRPSMARIAISNILISLGAAATGPIYIYFFKDVKGFTIADTSFLLIFYVGAGFFGAPFWGRLARRFGKHQALQAACVAYAISQAILMILPRVWPGHTLAAALPTAAAMFAVGFASSSFLLLMRAMVADVVDEVRLATGQDLTSQLYAVVTTIEKTGAAIAVAIIFPILQLAGYDGRENAVNTPHAIFALQMCYLFAPIVLVLVGATVFFGYRLDSKRHDEIRLALEERDTAAALEAISGPLPEAAQV
ncbi:MAG: MFS transporter [Rhizomicrobium sp.]